MPTTIVITYDNDSVSIVDNGKVMASGDSRMYHKMAQNVIDNADSNGYDVRESEVGHKRVVTLTPKEVK